MTIKGKVDDIAVLLQRVMQYSDLIEADNFEGETVSDMKGNAKDLCNEVKDVVNAIKDEINAWS